MDECIESAWNYGCQSAKWHNDTSGDKTCYCGHYTEDMATLEEGSDYHACFLEEYRDESYIGWAALTYWFATAGTALVAICICGPIVFCLCICIGIWFCCCRSSNGQQPAPAQQPTQIIMVPEQRQSFIQPQSQQVQMVGVPGNNVPNYSYTSS